MYSPTQQDFNLDSDSFQQAMTSQHTTVGAVPVRASQHHHRNSGLFGHPSSYHQRQNSFGTAASIAMSPPFNTVNPQAPNWFGTSLDSSSSFGQSPPTMFTAGSSGRNDLIVSPSTSTSHLDGFTGGNEDDEVQQRNLQEIFEKRRRRRESHNAVERRRRDNINERIQELSTLLPEHLLDNVPSCSNVNSSSIQNGGKAINKGTILKLSVDHIKDLRDEVARYQDRVQELERMIELAKNGQQQRSYKEEYHEQTSPTPACYIISPSSDLKGDRPLFTNASSTTRDNRHERVRSLQFQQQFGNLHIASDDPTSQS
ncbi:helix-loop-helix DNA-binding domain-containing protein [Chlamydoabsidia padenii]|nr:helix-loop-helix DNA-binding domain-containing protein [Chlamydoabsidia padenii]